MLLWEPGEITSPSDIRNFGSVGGRNFYFSFIVASCSVERNKCQSDWSVSKPLLVLVTGGQDPMGGGQFLPVSGLCGKSTSAGSGFLGCLPGAVFPSSLYAAQWISLAGSTDSGSCGLVSGSEEVGQRDGWVVRWGKWEAHKTLLIWGLSQLQSWDGMRWRSTRAVLGCLLCGWVPAQSEPAHPGKRRESGSLVLMSSF